MLNKISNITVKLFGVVIIASAGMALTSASAMAGEAQTVTTHAKTHYASSYVVKTTTDYYIRAGVTAYKSGDFKKSAAYSRAALETGLNPSRRAVAQSNLCAAYAQMGELHKAREACNVAINIRPELKIAQANLAALAVQVASK